MTDRYGIYLHIPFCVKKCAYCAFVSITDFSLREAYVKTLIGEIYNSPERGGEVDTVYIGGGTPSCMYDGALAAVIGALRECYAISENAEITVECNPESVTPRFIDECLHSGVNRISMGLQSANDKTLVEIGRAHDYKRFIEAAELLTATFDNVSTDIILGLPGQTADDVKKSIETAARYCKHVSVYALTVEDGTPLRASGYSPDDDAVADRYDTARRILNSEGFSRYEVSNFAINGYESKHNKKYWACEPYIGFGAAAHGYDGRDTRYRHADSVTEYIENPDRIEYKLSSADKYNEYIMLALRTEIGINERAFEERFGYSFYERNRDEIECMLQKGHLVRADGHTAISPEYMFVMNGIIERLMLDPT